MSSDREHRGGVRSNVGIEQAHGQAHGRQPGPGKVTLTSLLPAAPSPSGQAIAQRPQDTTAQPGYGRGVAGALPYRLEMEAFFGEDLSAVTASVGQADRLRGIHARGATQGEHVDFAEGNPSRDTVAHEVVHVLQYRRHGGDGAAGMSSPDSPAEREAESIANQFAGGGASPPIRRAPRADLPRLDLTTSTPQGEESQADLSRGVDFDVTPGTGASAASSPDMAPDMAPEAPAGDAGPVRPAEDAGPVHDPAGAGHAEGSSADAAAPPAPLPPHGKPVQPAPHPGGDQGPGRNKVAAPPKAAAGDAAGPATQAASSGVEATPSEGSQRQLAPEPVSIRQPDKVGEAIAHLEGVQPGQLERTLDDLRTRLPALQRQEAEALQASFAQPAVRGAERQAARPAAREQPASPDTPGEHAQWATLRDDLDAVDRDLPPPPRTAHPLPAGAPPRDEHSARRKEAAQQLQIERQHAQPQKFLPHSTTPTSSGFRPRLHPEVASAPASLAREQRANDARVAATRQRIDQFIDGAGGGLHALHVPEAPTPPLRIEPPAPPSPPTPPTPPSSPVSARAGASPETPMRPSRGPGSSGDAEGQAEVHARARVQAMKAQHEAQRAAHVARLDAVQSEGDRQLQSSRKALHEQRQAVQQQAHDRASTLRADWRARNHQDAARHASEVATLHASASECITTQARDGQRRAELHLLAAEQRAAQQKAERTEGARTTVERGRQRAAEILSAVALPCDSSYEARAVERSGVLMRQDDPSYTRDADAQRRAEDEAAARAAAQTTVDGAVAAAQESLDALLREIDELLRVAETLSADELANVQRAIEARLSEVRAIQERLASEDARLQDANAAAAIMQINMNMVQAMGRILEMTQAAAEPEVDILGTIQLAFQNAIVSHQANSTYYIFVPPARLDSPDITSGEYPNLPYSELGDALLWRGVDPTQMSYFQADGFSAEWGDELSGYMDTLAMLDPNAHFVLGGHSSSGRAVADAARLHVDNQHQNANPIDELLLFDPHIIYGPTVDDENPDRTRLTSFNPTGLSDHMEISVFWSEVGGTQYAYDGNTSFGDPDLTPHPEEWGTYGGDPGIFFIPLPDGTDAALRHYWIVGNMGEAGASEVAEHATTRRPRSSAAPSTPSTPSPTNAVPTQTPTDSPPPTQPATELPPTWPDWEGYSGTGTVRDLAEVHSGYTGTELTVRSNPDATGARAGTINEGASVTVIAWTYNAEDGHTWYQIQSGDVGGWVRAIYISLGS
jgi:hypothetical protein